MTNQPTILVLEDNINLLNGIRDILEIQGYHVLTAVNGRDGLEIMRLREVPPDLIISDIMMPHMDGYEFLKTVRCEAQWMGIPFIFLTAKGEKTDVRFGKSLGADDYLTKPFEAEDLVVVVAAKLRRSQELDQLQSSRVADIKHHILTILHHEFRTPLTYVVAYADMLNNDVDKLDYQEMKEFLKGINSGAERLRRLVENFILLVELETGEAKRTFDWRKHKMDDLHTVLLAAIEELRTYATERGVRVELEPVPASLPPFVGDDEYLRAVVMRLIDNAIKFSDKPNATVRVSARANGDYIHLSVADQGRGIPQHELDNIFELFYQINRKVYEDQGAGAGLPIVKRIVDLHGGQVAVASAEGEGSEFTISLPIIKE